MLTRLLQPQGSNFYLGNELLRWGIQRTPFLSIMRGPSRNPAMGPTAVVICDCDCDCDCDLSHLIQETKRSGRWESRGFRMAHSRKAKEQGHAEQDGGSAMITSHASKGHGEFCFCLNQSQSSLSINWEHLLFTFTSKRLPLQLYKLYRIENSIVERNAEFAIRVLYFPPSQSKREQSELKHGCLKG